MYYCNTTKVPPIPKILKTPDILKNFKNSKQFQKIQKNPKIP